MRLNADEQSNLQTRITEIIRAKTGLFEHLSLPIAKEIIGEVNRKYRGERIYCTEDKKAVIAAVRSEFNGKNHKELMRKYDISRATLYRYLGSNSKSRNNA